MLFKDQMLAMYYAHAFSGKVRATPSSKRIEQSLDGPYANDPSPWKTEKPRAGEQCRALSLIYGTEIQLSFVPRISWRFSMFLSFIWSLLVPRISWRFSMRFSFMASWLATILSYCSDVSTFLKSAS